MIIANLQDSARIESLHPAFKQLFDYLKSHDMLNEPMGKTELDGKVLYINNDEPTLRTKEAQAMEVHKDYIDVHIPLNGVEIIGWKATRNCTDLEQEYDEVKDRMFYNDRPTTYCEVLPGEFCICFPEDAHAPIIGEGKLRKVVAKVRL